MALVKSISSARRAVLCAVGCVALLAAFLSSAAAQTRVGFGVQHEQVAGAGGTLLWAARYDAGNGDDAASALAVRPVGGGFFVTGSSAGASTGDDYATIAYTSTGTMSWVSRYDGPSHAHDAAFALAVSPDGSKVFVAGESTGNAGLGYATIAYDAATGAELWAKRYDSSNGGPGSASSVDVSPDGSRVFVTGTSSSSYASIAYDAATGATLWRRRYDGPGAGADSAAALAVSPDGSKVFVTGTSGGGATGDDYATVAYDAVTGATVWVRRSNGPTDGSDTASALAVSPDSSTVFVTGASPSRNGDDDVATFAYDAATGSRIWGQRRRDSGDVDHPARLRVSPDGTRIFVTGTSYVIGALASAILTVAYDAATGDPVWEQDEFGGSLSFADDLRVSPDGARLYVAGANGSRFEPADYIAIAYDAATGSQLWQSGYAGPANDDDYATALGVSPNGAKLFVTGSSRSFADYDYATVAFGTG